MRRKTEAKPESRLMPRRPLNVPTVIRAAGTRASRRFLEFLTAQIRNRNTREAYHRALVDFLAWCEDRNCRLDQIEPIVVAAYVEYLSNVYSPPTVKQHLAAIRMCFDWLVTGQIIPTNPAASVRGPKHVVKRGKTPVLSADEARQLLDSIDDTTVIGLRDRAVIGVMIFTFARVTAVVNMGVPAGAPLWVTSELMEKTYRTWQPFYKNQLIRDDLIEIIMSIGRLVDVLSSGESHETVRRIGPGKQPRAGT